MARANRNKSKKLITNTTAASKYIFKRRRICTISDQIYEIKKTPLSVNIVKQDF